MIIDENTVRHFIKCEKERENIDERDEVTVLVIAAQAYIQLYKCASNGDLNQFTKERVMDAAKLINNLVMKRGYCYLDDQLVITLKKILDLLNIDYRTEGCPITDHGGPQYGAPLSVMDEDEVKKIFTEKDMTYLWLSWFAVSAITRGIRIRLENEFLEKFIEGGDLTEVLSLIMDWDSIEVRKRI